jgi:phosphoglycerol transferase MdoB-like AlkP superfamily enzyme
VNLPAPPLPKTQAPGRSVGIAAIVCGVLGLLFLPIVFGPIAVVLGIVAISQGYRTAWVGIILGGIQVFIVAQAFYEFGKVMESIG